MCTGACLRAAARHLAQLGLGPGAHNSPAELAPHCSCGPAITSYTAPSAAASTRMHMT